MIDINKLKYSPGIGTLTYRSNGKPYRGDDAVYIAWYLFHGYESDKPLTLVNPDRGLIFDNITQTVSPVELPEGITEVSKGLYQVEHLSIVYGVYRDLKLANKVLNMVKEGEYKRKKEYFLDILNMISYTRYSVKH